MEPLRRWLGWLGREAGLLMMMKTFNLWNETMYAVEVKTIDGMATYSTHDSYRDAVDQADMVRGVVAGDRAAWKYATAQQGFDGDYAAWQSQDDNERAEYECGAEGIGIV